MKQEIRKKRNMKQLLVELEGEDFFKFKSIVAINETNMKVVISEFVKSYIKKNAEK